MKTTNVHNKQFSFTHNPQTDAQLQADFDDLAMGASHGDKRALGAIAIALSPTLLEEARAVMGDFEQEAGDVLQDFFLTLAEGRSRFTPAHERAIAWMCGIIRAMARKHRAECEKRWGIDDDP
jgi:DNA-directed RNA polymerase specialized sigma24 family protein